MTGRLHFHFSLSCIGGGNGNTLQCSCLENPRDSGAWWAAVYGVAQSRTRLKQLSSSSSSQYSCLENILDSGAWQATVHGVTKSWTRLSTEHTFSLSPHSKPVAAAAAKSLQLCPTLCDPKDGSPPGSPIPGSLQARTLECVAISFFNA